MTNVVYFWLGLGLLLLAAETVVPGAFMLWFGLAALAMGAVVAIIPGLAPLAQLIIFSVLSLVSIQIYRTWFRGREPQSDQPLLNQRAAQLIGRSFELQQPIHNGFGKVKIGDALWTVTGPDLPAGSTIVVRSVEGITLRVEPGASA
jgi:hypothetical protein